MKTIFAFFALSAPVLAQANGIDVQRLVDDARPGSVVFVPGGHHAGLVLTKSVTIVAEPRAEFDRLALAGPGSGGVTLANVAIHSDLRGFGFDALRLVDSEVEGALRPAADVRYVEVARSTLGVKSLQVKDEASAPDVDAPAATVVLLDVAFANGSGTVNANMLIASASTAVRSSSARSNVTSPNDLVLTGNLRLGQPFTLTWDTPGPKHALLFASVGTRPPVHLPGVNGFWYLAPGAVLLTGIPAGVPCSLTMSIPNSPSLLGLLIAFQVHDGPDYLSRPVMDVIGP